MKAVYRTVYGSPEILEVREVDLPKPKKKKFSFELPARR